MSFDNISPRLTYGVRETTSNSPQSDNDYDVIDRRLLNGGYPDDIRGLPELPDFTKRPKHFSENSSSVNSESYSDGVNNHTNPSSKYFEAKPSSYQYDPSHVDSFTNNTSNERPSLYHSGSSQSRNASVLFFSEDVNDEDTFNDIPLKEDLDDFDYDELDSNIESLVDEESQILNADMHLPNRMESPTPYYSSLGKDISRAESPFLPSPKAEYTTDIPDFYDPEKLKYPYKSPLDYNDEDFENMNHFEFLKDLDFSQPPLLPVYLNSNLLNDSSSKNYKTFPYQYQESTVPHVNEIYRYRINDLNTMDKYSTHKVSRAVLKRTASSNSSSSSLIAPQRTSKTSTTGNKLINKARLLRENSNGNGTRSKLKHSDKLNLIERSLIPHHVMLNHLITCNLNKDGYITSSCITRYKGKFITQIMYFSNDIE